MKPIFNFKPNYANLIGQIIFYARFKVASKIFYAAHASSQFSPKTIPSLDQNIYPKQEDESFLKAPEERRSSLLNLKLLNFGIIRFSAVTVNSDLATTFSLYRSFEMNFIFIVTKYFQQCIRKHLPFCCRRR